PTPSGRPGRPSATRSARASGWSRGASSTSSPGSTARLSRAWYGSTPSTGHGPSPRSSTSGRGSAATATATRTSTTVAPPRPAAGAVCLGRDGLLAGLRLIADDLRRVGAEAAASGALKDMIRLVEVFGVHLLTLDLRQHSGRHTQALDEVFRAAGVCDGYAGL